MVIKVAVGLSGGVDSALSAAFLAEQGFDVTGVFLECWNEPGCRTDEDRKDALKVALKLNIPFRVLDFKSEYRRRVLDWCYAEFKKGRTPNPDVLCNREIKFGLFLEWARRHGFDKVATGHYAQIVSVSATRNFLRAHSYLTESDETLRAQKFALPAPIYLAQSVDRDKDQTYFLALLKQEQLRRVMFPIGHLTKKQVRAEARKRGLPVWHKKDSTGICFIGHDLSFKKFLQRKIKIHTGEVVDKNGQVIGSHDGVEFYTVGQRHGFMVHNQTSGQKPLFVIHKDIKSNRLMVGEKRDLAKKEFAVDKWSWISGIPDLQGESLRVRIRHQGRLIPCRIEGMKVKLEQPEMGIAPGQVAVVYDDEICLGGGVII